MRPRRTTHTVRLYLMGLTRFFDWRDALIVVKPATFVKWHRIGFRAFWKSRRRRRPRLPHDLHEVVRRMARENPTWGEECIAANCS